MISPQIPTVMGADRKVYKISYCEIMMDDVTSLICFSRPDFAEARPNARNGGCNGGKSANRGEGCRTGNGAPPMRRQV
jgi:hypothetical protein